MNAIVEKVLERLSYERLLLASQLTPKRRRITLEDIFKAGKTEPRVLQTLPAILLYKPSILRGLEKDLKVYPALTEFVETLFSAKPKQPSFLNVDIADCRKTAMAFRNYLKTVREKRRSRLFNFRLNEEDLAHLQLLSKKMGIENYSELIRHLVYQAVSRNP